ncbi:MAG: LPS biosynthesis protein [Candidatus Magasanikbacteria bacterium RIFOXYC2_FULL_40_16]|uniref:LPS biosynthesis protein n=3 Tax=Candidatus Magasanikiibacteriota TaxID=1752731 RepID=A0A1F6NJ06_9BACT|nr:MAG: LPS biosynthesis protein [Candidatus Magasanikbacteria bacterium RIFOXYA2_FULL_40_20]OGH83911.1 MAG: LPS biosynthesis protein [Candidatus Magasanikbacteria bacterium RIFOXYB1_FULL_40_15]OGH85750.1 MAG: LPS biosynthesis protein [Candidatus Magasanikbacteria bacterium RIFOXYB2_FULL_40_13]OGH87159.1 MAG: LPS biosynthesis protein [Candidatus Magasanikbacteria bacterium RIFOXYA1_FULL_40_8]OGH89270.1 MAG: LPS biosynthesis protein [Candidatus Magasanikbacteria bacterium RIFOXYC2_FULL_40_16]
MKWCAKCLYPESSAVKLSFDEKGVCSGCSVNEQKAEIDWDKRAEMLKEIVETYRSKDGSNYDCIIPVSGGKDSHYQTYYMTKKLGLKPLLVTYHGNNYLEVGEENLKNMRNVFDVDHMIFSPSVEVLKKLNRICFKLMGDMNWHAHAGIFSTPVQVAVKFNIPLIIWGEHGRLDLGGQYSLNDLVEMTARDILEHCKRGYDWDSMTDEGLKKLGRPELSEGLTARDLFCYKYPDMRDIARVGVRGLYLGNYISWDANKQTKFVIDNYNFKISEQSFDRTYRKMSNLDDMHENGIHDYLKYIKFGYGRATDHASKDIRLGIMTREEGIEMVKKYDHVKPRDLYRWLEYVGMKEEEFDRVCDTFRDPKVWRKNDKGEWEKDNMWDDKK